MSCTTILVGKKASYDGSTIIARDDDSGSGRYDPKKFIAVAPQDQPRHYRSVLSHVEIDLPDNPCRYSIVPNVLPNRGILAEAGVNECNVAMSATETIAVNERVLAADPLVELQPANEAADTPEVPGGIGEEKDFSEIIEHAKKCPPPEQLESGTIVGGFAHAQVFALADQIVDAVRSGAIRNFVVMAGCDGRFNSREYYTEFAKVLPDDTVILTAGCAKYRYNKLDLGDINGIPRVLDAGQCNDSYSIAVIALKLQELFGLDDINELPVIYNIAWYEQKAVLVLLALLSLGIKNIHLGPTLPAFLSLNVTKVLVENFGIAGITNVEEDMELFFGN